ncbi:MULTISPECIES: toxin YdaT family protein [Serratia]|uniref:toxin YdaT family protein n=1 Tax=Serratia TaxID=613 RepID=UPI00065FAE74|nr:toxin YdaT family protein [Serratia sp. 506_PEND]
MKIKHGQMREALRGWATETTQRTVAVEITRAYFDLQMQEPHLVQIERSDGSVDDAAWHNNKQQLFRWLDGDSASAQQKIQQLQPAILAALPAELRARLVAGNSIEYLAIRALKEHQEAIAAALLHASPADFERECDEAERSLYELRRAYSALH